ncbi:exo-alpha-sialidase, partial [Trypanosoma cruzi]
SGRNETTVRLSVGLQANRLAAPQPTERGILSRGDAVVVPVTPAAMPCCNHSHRETIKSLVDVCREHSDCHRQRRPSWHRPSRVSTHRATHAPGKANTQAKEE